MKGTSLFAAIVAILVAFTAYDFWSGQKKDEAKVASDRIARIEKTQLKLIEVSGTKNHFSLEKVDGHWNISKPLQESADQQVVMTYIDQLYGEKAQADVAAVATADDLKKYGLDTPVLTLHLKGADKDSSVKLGSVRAFDGSLYAQVDAEAKVLLVNSTWDVLLSKLPAEFRDTKLYHGPMTVDYDSIQVTGPSNYSFIRKDGKYEMVKAGDAVDQEAIKTWIEQIKALRGAAYVENPKAPFKADFTIAMKAKDVDFTLQVAHDRAHPEQFEVTSSDLPGKFASRVLASPRALDSILLKADAFYDRKTPFAFDPKQVSEVRFKDDGQTRETKVDPATPDELLKQLSQLTAVRYLGPATKTSANEKKFPSKLTLLKSDGSLVFEMAWGDPVYEKSDAGVESEIVPVKTNLSKQIVGVPAKLMAAIAKRPAPETPTSPTEEEKGR